MFFGTDEQAARKNNEINNILEIIKEKDCLKRGYTVFWKGHVGIMADEKNCIHANAYHMEVTKEPLIDIYFKKD